MRTLSYHFRSIMLFGAHFQSAIMAEEQQTRPGSVSAADVSAALKKGTLTLKKCNSLKSDIWKSFSLVFDAKEKQLPFACCDKCHKILSYSGHKFGTSGLKRHVCHVLKGQKTLEFRGKDAKPLTAENLRRHSGRWRLGGRETRLKVKSCDIP